MSHAKEVTEAQEPQLHAAVHELALSAGLPVPKVYVMEQDQPNAFATGRDPRHAAVAATSGIMRILDRDELRAALAHELGHVKNRYTLTATIVATLAGAISMLTFWAQWALIFGGGRRDGNGNGQMIIGLATIILAPIAAMTIQMGISRAREYQPDRSGARISGNPLALASALRKLEQASAASP